jgi:hypothetical protein
MMRSAASALNVECFMACDYASYEHGKFFISGGGWDRITPPSLPHAYNFYLAIKLSIPAGEVTGRMDLAVQFTDEQGAIAQDDHSLSIDPGDARGEMSRVSIPLALRVETTLVRTGEYGIQLLVDGQVVARTFLNVEAPQSRRGPTSGNSGDS